MNLPAAPEWRDGVEYADRLKVRLRDIYDDPLNEDIPGVRLEPLCWPEFLNLCMHFDAEGFEEAGKER